MHDLQRSDSVSVQPNYITSYCRSGWRSEGHNKRLIDRDPAKAEAAPFRLQGAKSLRNDLRRANAVVIVDDALHAK